MSMKGMGGLNHKYQEKPTSYTNNIHSQAQRAHIRLEARAASLWPLATVAGAKLHYIYIKMT
jgi:hypothetical protein